MKKILFISVLALSAMTINAQTYHVIARSNDSILLYPNTAGTALKSIIPGGNAEVNYRMIKKIDNGKESVLFVEFVNVLDKFLVTYENDLVTSGRFATKIHSLLDVYSSLKRVNAIYLEGEYLGMKAQVYQRPLNFKDVFVIDEINLQLPIKIVEIDAVIAEKKQKDEAKLKKIESIGLTMDIMEDASNNKCEYYIAYLIMTQNFNTRYRSDIGSLYAKEKIDFIIKTYSQNQLHFIVKECNAQEECGKYAID